MAVGGYAELAGHEKLDGSSGLASARSDKLGISKLVQGGDDDFDGVLLENLGDGGLIVISDCGARDTRRKLELGGVARKDNDFGACSDKGLDNR